MYIYIYIYTHSHNHQLRSHVASRCLAIHTHSHTHMCMYVYIQCILWRIYVRTKHTVAAFVCHGDVTDTCMHHRYIHTYIDACMIHSRTCTCYTYIHMCHTHTHTHIHVRCLLAVIFIDCSWIYKILRFKYISRQVFSSSPKITEITGSKMPGNHGEITRAKKCTLYPSLLSWSPEIADILRDPKGPESRESRESRDQRGPEITGIAGSSGVAGVSLLQARDDGVQGVAFPWGGR
jgi:hypothetical protein